MCAGRTRRASACSASAIPPPISDFSAKTARAASPSCRRPGVTPTAWGEVRFMPRVRGGWFLRSAMAWEGVGAALSLPFAGVHIVEATKQVYRAIPAHRERTRLIPALEPVLVPSSLQRDDV